MLESSLTATPAKEEEKGFTEAEENTLDTIMQGLDLDSDGELVVRGGGGGFCRVIFK